MATSPNPAKKSNKTFWIILAGLGFFSFFSVLFLVFAFRHVMGDSAPPLLAGSGDITLMEIEGPIYYSDDVVRRVRRFRKSSSKVLLLRLNSPGGAVAPSQEIYQEVLRARDEDKKIVVASVSSLAASGAYYIAAAANRIVANPGSVTGSIGVIAEFTNASGLLDKVGLKFETVKSGKFKDTGSMSRPMSPMEREYLQATIDDVFAQFLEAVVKGRKQAFQEKLAPGLKKKPSQVTEREIREHVLKSADGRILTGNQAFKLGFVDKLGNYYDAVKLAGELAGIEGEPRVRADRSVKMEQFFDNILPWRFLGRSSQGLRLEYRSF